jgi:septal ring factor EnvC (AmiA/AmiB activator)
LLQRKNAIEQILLHDEVMLKKHLADKETLAALSDNLNHKRRAKIDLENALQRQADILIRKRAERQMVLKTVRNKKALLVASLEAVTVAAKELDQTILQLQKEAAKLAEVRGKAFDSRKGLLDLPVSGNVIAFFGPYKNQRFDVTNFRSGVEIGADRGEPVRAVLGGRVLYSGWFKNYGNMIIVDHGDHYYTLYAHAEELFKSKGDYVETQEVIATVGDSASLTGTNLYFEVRHHGKPLDPMAWLKAG